MRTPFDANGDWAAGFGAPRDDDNDANHANRRYRSIFISDIHLGTAGCQAGALLDFLKSHHSDHLYLVGDIVDGWQLRRKWYWPQSHNDVVQKLLKRARKGCRIVFVPGNHDEFARQFASLHFGGIEVASEAVCGHIHRAEMRDIDGILYCNDGDWVESRTALVEHFDGRLELLEWQPAVVAAPLQTVPRLAT